MKRNPNPTQAPKVSKWRYWSGLVVCVALFAVVIAFAAGEFRTFRVVSSSMTPTLSEGDFVLMDSTKPMAPSLGDIVALENPKDPQQWLCKRVVAGPGDVIAFRDGYYFLNGEIQDHEPYVKRYRMIGLPDVGPYVLGDQSYFVMGDNRGQSYDSLDFGPVHRNGFLGIAVAVYWPWGRWKWLRRDGSGR